MAYFKYTIPVLALVTALGLSAVSGYMSIVGLLNLFGTGLAAFILVEVGKVVTTLILHKHWNHGFGLVKLGLVVTVILSMAVTSIGVFGYLSKASSQGKQDVTINSSKLESIEQNIQRKQSSIDRNLSQIDKYNEMLSRLITDNPTKAQKERKSIQSSIKQLEADNKKLGTELDNLHEELIPFKKEVSKHEVEIGPLLYITKWIYGEEYKSHAEDALIYLIVTFMVILDPFAVMLLIASQKSFERISGKRIRRIRIKQPEKIEQVDESIPEESSPKVIPDEYGIPVPVNVVPETRKSYKVGRSRRP